MSLLGYSWLGVKVLLGCSGWVLVGCLLTQIRSWVHPLKYTYGIYFHEFNNPPDNNCLSNHLESNSTPILIKMHDLRNHSSPYYK